MKFFELELCEIREVMSFLEYLIQQGWQALSVSLSLLLPLNFPVPSVELVEAYLAAIWLESLLEPAVTIPENIINNSQNTGLSAEQIRWN